VSDSDGVSRESELNRDARFGGPSLVNRPRRGYLVDPDGAGCLKSVQLVHRGYDEDSLIAGVS